MARIVFRLGQRRVHLFLAPWLGFAKYPFWTLLDLYGTFWDTVLGMCIAKACGFYAPSPEKTLPTTNTIQN
eukprot:3557895-Amphidinium_carterae.1